jgi:hypothetical protein
MINRAADASPTSSTVISDPGRRKRQAAGTMAVDSSSKRSDER